MASLLLVGPGRAGMSVALAAREAGHSVVGVLARSGASDAAQRLDAISLDWESDSLPSVDMLSWLFLMERSALLPKFWPDAS